MAAAAAVPQHMEAILSVLTEKAEPMLLEAISAQLPQIDVKAILAALSELINKYYVKTTAVQGDGNATTYMFSTISEDDRRKFESLDRNSVIVYRLIEERGGSGIWRKDIKAKAKLPEQELTKIIKILSDKFLIRELKTTATKNKKTYIIFELAATGEHETDVLSGQKSEFDPLLVHSISMMMYNHIRKKPLISFKDMETHFVGNPAVLNNGNSLNQKQVHRFIEMLKYDGLIELLEDNTGGERLIKLSRQPHGSNHLTEVPCGKCPVYDACGDVGDITPVSCPYFQRWLDF